MKILIRILFVVTLGFLYTQSLFAQAKQNGIVLEYNERNQKTPLADVEILIRNAGSTISDKEGKFILTFRTSKTGDKVMIRRIEKLGYEIFNKDALEEWNITSEQHTFIIVMCKSEKFKRIRDNYFRVSSESYAKQYKMEEKRLESLKKKGEIMKDEYEKALISLKEQYEIQLNNLDNYVDRFARIDLSELSEKEAEIIKMVENGNIEGAIAAYEEMNLEEKYSQIAKQHRLVAKTIDSLSMIRQEHQVYKLHLDSLIQERDSLRKYKQ